MTWRSKFWKVAWTFLVLGLIFMFQPYRAIRVTGESMFPTFNNGQFVLVDYSKPVYIYAKHVYVIRHNDSTLIKRVAFTPGEWVYNVMGRDGQNEIIENMNEILLAIRNHRDVTKFYIPEGQCLILGDNSDISIDSRMYGLIPINEIQAEVIR